MLRKRKRSEGGPDPKENDVTVKNPDDEEDDTFDVNPKMLLIFVVLMCIMLVSLYFLYDYLGKIVLVH